MKKTLAIVLAMAMALSMTACGGSSAPAPAATEAAKEDAPAAEAPAAAEGAESITLWTYPIGNWGNQETVESLTAAFTAETGIGVTVEYLDYTNGDDQVNTALTAGQGPDLIMEGPERLVANWGASGYMVDLSDLLDDTDKSEIYESCMSACTATTGEVYEYPLVMTAHCMAVNVDAFKEAGADQYLDLENHTWTTDGFKAAVAALNDHFGSTIGAVYCAGQGGDQGTRALINNMYGGTFTNAEHTAYTWDEAANVKALEELVALPGIDFDPSLVGGDEINLFRQGVLKMAFCWNIAQQLNTDNNEAGLTNDGQEIAFMSFPSQDGTSQLCGGIWGFGIFNNGNDAKIAAAKQFIKYMCDSEHTVDAVKTANYFAVRDTAEGADLTGIWADNAIMNDYQVLMQYLGDYYQVTTNWAIARTAWWNMLQAVGTGSDVPGAVAEFCGDANNGVDLAQ